MACRIFPYQREYIHIYREGQGGEGGREREGEVFLIVFIDEVGTKILRLMFCFPLFYCFNLMSK